jgi:processive 1,2-diacylglycerol beta-glucosyltransferase
LPLFPIVADPVSISPLWGDSRSRFTICPTEEAREACIRMGVPEEKIKVIGFPVRERFTACLGKNKESADYDFSRPVNFTIMSGGEGSGSMNRIAKILAQNFDCRIRIICGRNKMLKKRLEYTCPEKYKKKIEILGFVTDIQNVMLDSDILITRASPNTFMEAVMCNVPLIITGALPGQEEGNPDFVEKHSLGVVCNSPKEIKATVQRLLDNHAEELNKIKQSQRQYRDPDAAKKIIDFILSN